MLEIDFENWKKGRVPKEIDNFSALIFMLVAKADADNLEKLRVGWPDHVDMYYQWLVHGNE